MHPPRIAALVVTYNRKVLLSQCLRALTDATFKPDLVLVADNASTDGTTQMLESEGWLATPDIQLLSLKENSGGAGGFAAGLRHLVDAGSEWIWMMDDDAAPHPEALEELLKVAKNPDDIYGSLAVQGEHTSWATTLLDQGMAIELASNVPQEARVEFIPLLGFLIHRSLVQRIGLPDADFFIAADDVEYCLRARQAGANIVLAGHSRIEHPRVRQSVVRLLGIRVLYLSLQPWKRYYDTRNRLLIARKYYGARLFTQAIPGTFLRLVVSLWREPAKFQQLRAFSAGIFDGLLGIKGKRHTKWGIPQ